jgi:signal transduction histidine kinase/uncharacterized protein YdeI (BOF family)
MHSIPKQLAILMALLFGALKLGAEGTTGLVVVPGAAPNGVLTNIQQLAVCVSAKTVQTKTVRLEGVVTWVAATDNAFVLQDDTGAMRFEIQRREAPVKLWQRTRLEGEVALLEGRAVLRQLLLVDNQGVHSWREESAWQHLEPGRYGLELDYFQGLDDKSLEVFYEGPNLPKQHIPDSWLSHLDQQTNWVAGLRAEYFEGAWDRLPDFDRLIPIRSQIATNFGLIEPNSITNFGLRFSGAIEIQAPGEYHFYVASDDGSRLSFDQQLWRMTVLGSAQPPVPQRIEPGELLNAEKNFRWSEFQGVVRFAGVADGRCHLELVSDAGRMQVEIDSFGLGLPELLANAYVRVHGVCEGNFNLGGDSAATGLLVPSLDDLIIERLPLETWQRYPSASIDTAVSSEQSNQVVHLTGKVLATDPGKSLVLEDSTGRLEVQTPRAAVSLTNSTLEILGRFAGISGKKVFVAVAVQPAGGLVKDAEGLMPIEHIRFMKQEESEASSMVKIRGVVTLLRRGRGTTAVTVNDGEHGISCWCDDPIVPLAIGDMVEVGGSARLGAFGPTLAGGRAKLLGQAWLPQPLKPGWDQLINGSLDQQWVEIEGVVQKIQNQTLTIEMHGGRIQAEVIDGVKNELLALQDAFVRIQGTVLPIFNSQRQIRDVKLWVSSPLFIATEGQGLADPFAAPLKTVDQLARFDPRGAHPFYRIKVHGQVVYADETVCHLVDGTNGIKCLLKAGQKLVPGDFVEAVGFPELGGVVPMIREALVRTHWHGAMSVPETLTLDELLNGTHDSTRVRIEGVLANVTTGQQEKMLGIQIGPRNLTARLGNNPELLKSIPLGSLVQLCGTYVGHDRQVQNGSLESIDLLLNSATDVTVLHLPPWWNAQRIMLVVVALISILLVMFAWVYMLRREVEQRTAQLKLEMRQRKQAELQHAADQERSRIARDLHDDLGSSLTEISLLASVGQPAGSQLDSPSGKCFQVIAGKARLLVNSLDVIVWAADPEEDEVQCFIDYLSDFTREFLSASGLICRFKIPIEFPPLKVDGRIRHGLYLAVKETLNNIVRHAHATEVKFGVNINETRLEIAIEDNGCGFNTATVQRGNGLNNLHERLLLLGGTCLLEAIPGAGTVVKIQLQLKST